MVTFWHLALGLCLLGVLLVAFQVFCYLRLRDQLTLTRREGRERFRQIQAFGWIVRVTPTRFPLPPLGGWTIDPEAAGNLLQLIAERQPYRILELGSGVSTLLMAYALESRGEGRLVSLEHDQDFAGRARTLLSSHGLDKTATVRWAPLREQEIAGSQWSWYDSEVLRDVQGIDLLFVDGPPGSLQNLSRYPALPMLFDALSPGALIVLDDAGRLDEQTISERWLEEFPELQARESPLERLALFVKSVPS